jgi:DNA-binding GntR family transcriptional regulator
VIQACAARWQTRNRQLRKRKGIGDALARQTNWEARQARPHQSNRSSVEDSWYWYQKWCNSCEVDLHFYPRLMTDSPLFTHAQNALLDILRAEVSLKEPLPTQEQLAKRIDTSRTTVHRILKAFKKGGLLKVHEGSLVLKRLILKKDYLPEPAALTRREFVERSLIEKLVRQQLRPGDRFSELALAREYKVTTVTIREALLSLAHLGIFSKVARKQWTVVAIDGQMISELMDLRILLETFALGRYFQSPSPMREAFILIREKMQDCAARINQQPFVAPKDFLALDKEFHNLILGSGRNRYLVEEMQFIYFPMHSQFIRQREWEPERFRLAITEHTAILDAIITGDKTEALSKLQTHLEHSRQRWLGSSPGILNELKT